MAGETNSQEPAGVDSAAKAAEGELSDKVELVTHAVPPPVWATVQPKGNPGKATASKFCDKGTAGAPNCRLNATVPRLVKPSCNCSTGLNEPPQVPLARKVNCLLTAVPPAFNTP